MVSSVHPLLGPPGLTNSSEPKSTQMALVKLWRTQNETQSDEYRKETCGGEGDW